MRLVCPSNCNDIDPTAPFLARIHNHEIPILVDREGRATNRWADGIAGIPQEIKDEWNSSDEMPVCVSCLTTAVREEN